MTVNPERTVICQVLTGDGSSCGVEAGAQEAGQPTKASERMSPELGVRRKG